MKLSLLKGSIALCAFVMLAYAGTSYWGNRAIPNATPLDTPVFLTGVELEDDRQMQVFDVQPVIHTESIDVTSYVVTETSLPQK